MDTISIISCFNEKILIENLLILNQKKLTDLVIEIFKNDFKDIDSDDLTLEFVKEYMDKQNFINWELFLRLLNLKTIFQYEYYNSRLRYPEKRFVNSLLYIFHYLINQNYSCNHKLIIFLLKLPEKMIYWNFYSGPFNTTILNVLFSSDDIFESNNMVLDLLVSNSSIKNELWGHIDEFYSTSVGAIFLIKCKNNLMIKQIFDQDKIKINQELKLSDVVVYPIDCLIYSSNVECIKYLLDLEVILDNENIYVQLSHCESVEVFRALDNYNFNLLKKNFNGNLLLDVFNIRSEDVLKYFIEKEYVELYKQIFYNAVLNNYTEILEIFFTNNLIEYEKITSVVTSLRLFFGGNYGYAKNMFINILNSIYTNVYNGIELYYVKTHENLENNYENYEKNN
jgi:hypothetical protein